MNKNEIKDILSVFREARNKLVSDFCLEDPCLYQMMFCYEEDSVQMRFAIEKYFYNWLNSHTSVFNKMLQLGLLDMNSFLEGKVSLFIEAQKKLCELFIKNSLENSNYRSDILISLVREKIIFLENLMVINDKSEKRIQLLQYQDEKFKRIFKREFQTLKGV